MSLVAAITLWIAQTLLLLSSLFSPNKENRGDNTTAGHSLCTFVAKRQREEGWKKKSHGNCSIKPLDFYCTEALPWGARSWEHCIEGLCQQWAVKTCNRQEGSDWTKQIKVWKHFPAHQGWTGFLQRCLKITLLIFLLLPKQGQSKWRSAWNRRQVIYLNDGTKFWKNIKHWPFPHIL